MVNPRKFRNINAWPRYPTRESENKAMKRPFAAREGRYSKKEEVRGHFSTEQESLYSQNSSGHDIPVH
jgi:hypothetical protein